MARKVFDIPDTAEQPPRQPEFTLGGEDFDCIPDTEMSSLDVLDYLAGMSSGTGISRVQTVSRLFNHFIPEGDVERFRKTIREKKIPLTVLNEIASWVLDEYLSFPTREDAQSSDGSLPGSRPSGDGSSPPPDAT